MSDFNGATLIAALIFVGFLTNQKPEGNLILGFVLLFGYLILRALLGLAGK